MEYINNEIDNNPGYTAISSMIIGILFSGVSFGLVYVIIFILLWEFLYFGYLDCNNKKYNVEDRIIIALSGIMGFLLGRFLHSDDDHYEEFRKFQNDYEYYKKEFGWFDTKGTKKRMIRKKREEIRRCRGEALERLREFRKLYKGKRV